ncbi:gliding motility-associated ABC transporter ATP-binding subunit GldA [Anditalea andensis]|uniref:Gliding motility protein GldA n=1 Tax=Anditalea andensis TaxID=1048983 RepID=A0A074KYN4_9BACT|nr:gliding motility-associated ABC transporter ATP-binding subunit GldA [Anditalea andensis]KEO75086.1 gliding motility protein GldA [Anditalea andensis]
MSLEVRNLSKNYHQQKALNAISFQANEGQVLGFLGPNGAGKSTTMKIATGFILPDDGDVIVNGVSVVDHPKEISKMIGYLPEHNPLYLDMYVREFLEFVSGLYEIKGRNAQQSINLVVDRCGLGPEQHKKIGQLSKGYRQRVGLAKALVHDPKVIILDEPTTGLDPNQLVEIRKLIVEISRDKTLILSTHIMQEVEAICEKVVIIHKGQIVAQDLLLNLKSELGTSRLILETEEMLDKAWFSHLSNVAVIESLKDNTLVFLTQEPGPLRKEILPVIQRRQLSLIRIQQEEKNLEAIFHQLTQQNA